MTASNLHSSAVSVLKQYYHFEGFRPGQYEIIEQVVHGNDALVIMPTGGGKSLCYQIPALLLPGTALIISPLIALMKDQVDALKNRHIPAALINSTITQYDQQLILNDVQNGHVKLLYVSPERLQNSQFMSFLRSISLSFIAVDEAHCISEWGHDFRPAYTSISTALHELQHRPPIIALTATATPEVQQDIIQQLLLRSPFVHVGGFFRKNIHYQVVKADNKVRWLSGFIKKRSKEPNGALIVYCGSRRRVEEYSKALQQESIPVLTYHAGLPDAQRQRVQDEFLLDHSSILIATNAFGMGVDKANVDCIIHCDITLTLEAYYQESGRAGRNGADADCIVLYSPKDRDLMDFFISCTYPEKEDIISVYNVLFGQTPIYGYLIQPILLTLEQIGNACGVHALKVNTIVQLMERNGILSNGGRHVSNKTIRILAQSDELKQRIVSMQDHDRGIMMAMLRTIGPEAMLRHVPFDIQKMIRTHHLQSVYVTEAISRFSAVGLIEIGQSAQHSGITLLQQRLPIDEIPIDFEQLNKRHLHAIAKLDSVIEYMVIPTCKQRFLLDYFRDESSTMLSCGTCSSCKDHAPELDDTLHARDLVIKQSLLSQIAELSGHFGKKTIISCIMGDISDYNVKKYALNRSKYFGILKGYASFMIREALEDLINHHYVSMKSGEYPIISITKEGESQLLEPVIPIQIQLHSTPQETLLKTLKKTRSEFGKNDALIHTFFSDPMLKLMMNARPSNEEELQSLCAIPKDIAQKYGATFIATIAAFNQVDDEAELSQTVKTTLAFIEQGYSLFRIAETRRATIGTIAKHIEQLIESGYQSECMSMVPQDLLEQMRALYKRMPYGLLKHFRAELGDGYEYAELRIALALIKKSG